MFENANKELEKLEIQNDRFIFRSTLLNKYIDTVYKHSEANYYQIEVITFAMFGFVFGYGGLNKSSMYVADIIDSSLGKSHNVELQNEMLLRPIFKLQEQKQIKANRDFKSDDNKSNSVKKYINIHTGRFYLAGLMQSFATNESQMIIFDEMGDKLNRNDELIPFVVSAYNKRTVQAPHLKSDIIIDKLEYKSKLSFIGLSSTEYLGNKFEHHLKGGLFSRCLLTYNTIPRDIELLPDEYELQSGTIKYYNDLSLQLISFAKECNRDKFIFNKTKIKAFHKELHQQKISLKKEINDFSYLYARIYHNLINMVHILHYIKCFEDNKWSDTIDDDIINEAIEFIKQRTFKEIPKIIEYLTDEISTDKETTAQ